MSSGACSVVAASLEAEAGEFRKVGSLGLLDGMEISRHRVGAGLRYSRTRKLAKMRPRPRFFGKTRIPLPVETYDKGRTRSGRCHTPLGVGNRKTLERGCGLIIVGIS